MLKFLGISAMDDADASVPAWRGVSKKSRVLVGVGALVLAIAVFFTCTWLLDGHLQGFVVYVPWLASSAALLMAIVLGERGLVRGSR